jgi:hypothetical protein
MLSSSNFRIRASAELTEIRDEILDLATGRDVYWKVQREVIQQKPRLLNARNAFSAVADSGPRGGADERAEAGGSAGVVGSAHLHY